MRKSTTLRGTLVFTGQLDPTATSLTLITNEKGGGDNQYSTRPIRLAALNDAANKRRLACVLEIVGDHAHQPDAQRHGWVP